MAAAGSRRELPELNRLGTTLAVLVRRSFCRKAGFSKSLGYNDPKDRLPVPEEITRYCSSLVILISRPGSNGEEGEVKEIQLAHFSVKDYLTSNRLQNEIGQYLRETIARSTIAEVCLAYLLEFEQNQTAEQIRNAFHFA